MELEKQLRLDIADLMRQAEEADNREVFDGQSLPKEIARHERLLEKMEQAQVNLKNRADAKADADRKKYEQKLERYEERQEGDHRGGHKPKPPENKGPQATDQSNLTDDDSRLMRKNRRAGFHQAYNAQAAVDEMVLSDHVTNCASDAGELEPALQGIDPAVGKPRTTRDSWR